MYGPKAERKSPLNVLSGEHYGGGALSPSELGVPLLKRKDKSTQVKGRVVIRDGVVEIPLRGIKLNLIYKDKTVLSQTSGMNGEFEFIGIIENGSYFIKIEDPKYSGEITLNVDEYTYDGLVVLATPM